jgi:hypothetical protein
MFEDKVLKHKRAEGYYRRNAALGNVDGAWKNFVEANKVPDPSSMKLAELPRSEWDNFNTPDLEQTPDSVLKPGETLEDFDVTFRRPNADGGRIGFYEGGDYNRSKMKKLADAFARQKYGRTLTDLPDVKRFEMEDLAIKSLSKNIENKAQGGSAGQLVRNTVDGSRPGYKGPVQSSGEKKTTLYKKLLNDLPEGYLEDYKKIFLKDRGDGTFSLKPGDAPKGILDMEKKYGDVIKKMKTRQGEVKNITRKIGEMNSAIKKSLEKDNLIVSGLSDADVVRKTDLKIVGDIDLKAPKGMNTHHFMPLAGVEGESINLSSTKNTAFIDEKLNKKMSPYDKRLKANQKEQIKLLNEKPTGYKIRIKQLNFKAKNIYKEAGKKVPGSKGILGYSQIEVKPDGTYDIKVTGIDSNKSFAGLKGEEILYKNISNADKIKVQKIADLTSELGGKEKLTKLLTNGSGTGAERTLLKQIITGGNTILKGTGKFVAGALNPVDFFRLKNLIGLPAAIAAVGFDTVAIADDVFRKGQPFDVAAGNEFLTQFLDLNTESKQAQRILDDKGSNLSPAAKEYAEALVDFGKYKNLLKEKNDVSKTGSLETFEEDQAKFDAQLKVLEEKFSNTREDGMLDYQAAVNELGINEEQSEYIGEPKKAGMFTYAADDTNTIPKYPFLTEDMGTGQSRSDGFYRNADGNRIKVNEYGYATKGNIFDIPGKTGARVDKKLPYGETDQGRNPALLTEGEKIFRAETKQPAKYQKPFTYKDFNYQNKALSEEQYNKILKYYQDQGFIKPGQKLENVNIPKGYNKRIVNGKEYDPPKTLLQYVTDVENIDDKWKQAIYQPGMLGAGDKFAEGGIANTRIGFKTGSSIASLLSKFFKPKPKKTITIKRGESGTIGASGNSEKDFFNRYYFPPKGSFTNQSADARYFSKLGGPKGKPKVLTAEITPQELKEGYRLRSLDSKDPEIGDIIIPQSAKDKVKTDYYNTIRARIEKILKNND